MIKRYLFEGWRNKIWNRYNYKNLDGSGRVLIRPSGTEPLVRVMLEGENQKEIDKLAHGLAKLIENKVK